MPYVRLRVRSTLHCVPVGPCGADRSLAPMHLGRLSERMSTCAKICLGAARPVVKRHVCTPSLLAGASDSASQHSPGAFEREGGSSESTLVGSWATLYPLGPLPLLMVSYGSGAQ